MSSINRLEITAVRNINRAEFDFHPVLNLLFGENGSGKTSILEALYLLATGRSFRSIHTDQLISHDSDEAVIFARLEEGETLGLVRPRRQSYQLKFEDRAQRNWDVVARAIPIQVLDASSFLLLEGGPKARRRFLDWGVFHVEQQFVEHWRKTRKCIANRNSLLKAAHLDREQLKVWDRELAYASRKVDSARVSYLQQFEPIFHEIYLDLAGEQNSEVSLTYHRGWDKERELEDVLAGSIGVDSKYRATQYGPHRADIELKIGSRRALEVMSRGQQKILVSSLKIAQGKLLSNILDSHCIYLVDDLPSELDRQNRRSVLHKLLDLGSQLFVTCVETDAIIPLLPEKPEMATFHVERGTITT